MDSGARLGRDRVGHGGTSPAAPCRRPRRHPDAPARWRRPIPGRG